MEWNQHFNLQGKHALLSGSQHSWLNYNADKAREFYKRSKKKEEGTYLHDLASRCIITRTKLAPLRKAINQFVNDAIGFGMESEKVLYYSDYVFGTADAISFKNNVLRIHDLKTGDGPVTKFTQLDIYSALFCLEYGVNPLKIDIEERLYQGNQFTVNIPNGEDIKLIMNKIKELNEVLSQEADAWTRTHPY
jgi:hypothetical protein